MSATDTQPQSPPEPAWADPTSSFEVNTTAKGSFQWRCKVRAQSNRPQDVQEAFELQMKLADEMAKKYGGAVAS